MFKMNTFVPELQSDGLAKSKKNSELRSNNNVLITEVDFDKLQENILM